jgi:hypothetical protein
MKIHHSIKGLIAILAITAMTAACSNEANEASQSGQQVPKAEASQGGSAPSSGAQNSEADPVAAAAEKAMEDAENRLDDKASDLEASLQKSTN